MRYLTGKPIRKPQKTNDQMESQDEPSIEKSSEMNKNGEDLPVSESYPDLTPLNRTTYSRRIGLVIVLLALAASSWFCFIGPGSTLLENNLQKLKWRTQNLI